LSIKIIESRQTKEFHKINCGTLYLCDRVVFVLVNYQIKDWNLLKKELLDWNTVLDSTPVKKVRELVLA